MKRDQINRDLAEVLYDAASDACTLIADMQPNCGTNHAEVLIKLDRALKAFESTKAKEAA